MVEERLTYTLGSKEVVNRALNGRPITDKYNLQYMMEVKQRQEFNSINTLRDKQITSFRDYSQ